MNSSSMKVSLLSVCEVEKKSNLLKWYKKVFLTIYPIWNRASKSCYISSRAALTFCKYCLQFSLMLSYNVPLMPSNHHWYSGGLQSLDDITFQNCSVTIWTPTHIRRLRTKTFFFFFPTFVMLTAKSFSSPNFILKQKPWLYTDIC